MRKVIKHMSAFSISSVTPAKIIAGKIQSRQGKPLLVLVGRWGEKRDLLVFPCSREKESSVTGT